MPSFTNTSKYQLKKEKKKPSFTDTSKYKFTDTSKYQEKSETKPTSIPIVKSIRAANPNDRKGVVQQGKVPLKGLKRPDNPFAPLVVNALNSATLGLLERNTGAVEELKKKAPITSTIGELAGYIVPGSAATKIISPLTKGLKVTKGITKGGKILNKVISTSAEGALSGGALGIGESIVKGKDLKQGAIDTALFAGTGAIANPAIMGIGKGLSKIIQKIRPKKVVEAAQRFNPFEQQRTLTEPSVFNKPIEPTVKFNAKTDTNILPSSKYNVVDSVKANKPQPKATSKLTNRFNPSDTTLMLDNLRKSGLPKDEVVNEIKSKIKAIEDEHFNFLKVNKNGTKNYDRGAIKHSDGTYSRYSVTDNPEWYSDFYKTYGRKPTNADLKNIAKEHLENGFQHYGDVPANDSYLALKKELAQIEGTNNKSYKFNIMGNKPIANSVNKPTQESNIFNNINLRNNPISEVATTSERMPIMNYANQTEHLAPSIVETQELAKEKMRLGSKAYDRIVDKFNPLKLVSKDTHIKAINSANTGNIVSNIANKELRDINGNYVDISFKKLLKDNVPKQDSEKFWQYMKEKLNVYRAEEIKDAQGNIIKKSNPVYPDRTPQQSTSEYKLFEREHPEWKAQANNITSWIDKFHRTWGVNTGITEKEMYEMLRFNNPDYIPTNREFSTLEKSFQNNVGGKGIINQTGVIKKATGSIRGIKAIEENMLNMIQRTVKTAKYNDVGQQMLKDLRNNPTQEIARIIPEGEPINPNVNNVVTILENGKPVNVEILDSRVLKALQGIDSVDGDITRTARKVTSKFTGLITHKNPLFAIPNAARDIQSGYVNSSIVNPVKYFGEMSKSVKDIISGSEAWKQYKSVGGGGSNFIAQDTEKAIKGIVDSPNIFKRAMQGVENFNSLMESAPRLTEFKKVFKETGDVNKALYAASDVTTNFSRGGDITKSVNAFVPFTNASVQGLDKLARSLDPRNPKRAMLTLIKGGIGITIPSAVLNYINEDNPNYKKLDNRTKDNYFLFPIPNSDNFFKLPKAREYGVMFGSLFERLHRLYNEEPDAFKGFGNTIATNFSPANPLTNNIAVPASIIALGGNKDFANRDIVPMGLQGLSPRYQFDEKTTELAKFIGDKTNMSPKKIDYLMRSYLGVISQVGSPIMTKGVGEKTFPEKLFSPIESKFTADPVYSNQTLTDFYDNYDEAKRIAKDKNFVENIPSKARTKQEAIVLAFARTQKQMTELNKKIKLANSNDEVVKYRKEIIRLADIVNAYADNLKKRGE